MATSKLAEAAALGQRLNLATEELNAALLRAENGFRELKFGVSASVMLIGTTNLGELSWEKKGQTWGFMVTLNSDPTNSCPLLKSSRAVRILAAKHLEHLLDTICEEVISQMGNMEESIAAVEATIVSLK